MENKKSKLSIFTNGFIKENPILVLVLGTCPTLAVSTMASNGIGMGLCVTFVLFFSNIFISALKKIIPAILSLSRRSYLFCRCCCRPTCPT